MIPFLWLIILLLAAGAIALVAGLQLWRWRQRFGGEVVLTTLGQVQAIDREAQGQVTLILQTASGPETVVLPGGQVALPLGSRRRGIRIGDQVRVEGIALLVGQERLYRQPGSSLVVDALRVTPRGWDRRRRLAGLGGTLLLIALLLTQWNVLVAGLRYGITCPPGTRVDLRAGEELSTVGCRRGAGYHGLALDLLRRPRSTQRCERTYDRGQLRFERCTVSPTYHIFGELDEMESGGFNSARQRHGLWRSTCDEKGKPLHQQGRYRDGRRVGVWTQTTAGQRREITVDDKGEAHHWIAWHASGKKAYRFEPGRWTRWDPQGRILEEARLATVGAMAAPPHAEDRALPPEAIWRLRHGDCPLPWDGTPEEVTLVVRHGMVQQATCTGGKQRVEGRLGPKELRFWNSAWKRELWRAVLAPGVAAPLTTAEISLLELRAETVTGSRAVAADQLRLLEPLSLSFLVELAKCVRGSGTRGFFDSRIHFLATLRWTVKGFVVADASVTTTAPSSTGPLDGDPFRRCLTANGWWLPQKPTEEVTARYTFSVTEGGGWKPPAVPRPVMARFCEPRF